MTSLILYYHPFSSFCQKALMALYEKQLSFRPHVIDLGNERERAELAAVWPYAKFPVLHDTATGQTMPESSLIAEYADGLNDERPPLIPADPVAARNVRLWDRVIDNYLHLPMQKIVGDRLRPEGKGDPHGVEEARATIATTYRLLDRVILPDHWLAGIEFSLADCSAAPPLFYAAKLAPFDEYPRLKAYFAQAMDRFSFKRCLDDARSFRQFFPSAPTDGPWPDEVAQPRSDGRVAF